MACFAINLHLFGGFKAQKVDTAFQYLSGQVHEGHIACLLFSIGLGQDSGLVIELVDSSGQFVDIGTDGVGGIPAINHHLYNFGNMPVFIAFGKKYRRNELGDDGEIITRKYVDMGFTLDERICDGYYYAAGLKYLKRIFNDPHRLDNPPETVVEDIS